MTEPIIIEIPAVDAKSFHIIEGGEQILTLTDDVIWFSTVGVAEEECDDADMPWKERKVDFRHFVMKNFVVGADAYWSPKNDVWKMDIAIQEATDWTLYFKTKSEALKVQDKILNWLTK